MNSLKKLLRNDFIANTLTGIFIKGISFLIPYLLIVPYLVRVLGEGQFGLISFSVGFVSLFFPLVEYGFMLTAPRDLLLYEGNVSKIAEITSNVILVKILLGVLSSVIVLCIIFLDDRLAQEATLHIFSLSLLWGQMIIPAWLYQGLGQLKKFALYTLLVNLGYLVFVISFIRSPADYLSVTLGQGVIWISLYSVALWQVVYPLRKYIRFSWRGAFEEFKKGFPIFLTNFFHFLFISSNIVILGFFVTGKELDNYSYAEKIYMVFRIISGVIYQMAYPKVFVLKQKSEKAADTFLIKLFFTILFIFGTISITLFWQSETIIQLFTGKTNIEASNLLSILSFSTLVYALSVPFSQKILVFYNNTIFSFILLLVVVFNIALNFYSVPLYGAKGTAVTLLLTEIFFLTLSGVYVFIAKNQSSK